MANTAAFDTGLVARSTMTAVCAHCGAPMPGGAAGPFCCRGCAGAHALIRELGLDAYYRQRDAVEIPGRIGDVEEAADCAAFVRAGPDGTAALDLMVEGLRCGACIWLIETALARRPEVRAARINMGTRRLHLEWTGGIAEAEGLVSLVARLGYRLVPFDPARLAEAEDRTGKDLLRALAVAGFASANIMMLSIAVWIGHGEGMGPATRDFLHWVSALIALPAIAYAGRPFFRSAWAALRHGRSNMDVPISIGVTLATAMSLYQTAAGQPHAYFDSAATLLFFLLIGRFLDHRARGRARAEVEQLLTLRATSVRVIGADGTPVATAPHRVMPGDRVLVAAGERLGVDGVVREGRSSLDTALVTGETVPRPAGPGEAVFAGTINLDSPLMVEATASGEGTLLAEIARLIEAAQAQRSRFVALADRVARRYAPVVHLTALATFLGWTLSGAVGWTQALGYAVAVLIITCPCALALAVPVVQVIAGGQLLRRGTLLKSATALERLAAVDTVVFDKTGTLTEGRPHLLEAAAHDPETLRRAAALALSSRHPLARTLVRAAPPAAPAEMREVPGSGLESASARLGSRAFCGIAEDGAEGPELWFAETGQAPVRFAFADILRPDAAETVAALKRAGLSVLLLSGDRAASVAPVAAALGIADWRGGQTPADKAAALAALRAEGRHVLMVGDGLNDAPALAEATVSMSPAEASDIAQTAADLVFQGGRLGAVTEALEVARTAGRLARQNIGLALVYNLLAVPLAVAGLVTPPVAAAAMSSSSLIVILNAFRLSRGRGS
jgi:Cu2+-exporting ATPase